MMTPTMILLNVAGAIALMVWAVRMVRTGITRALGGRLHQLIGRAAGNRFKAFLNGMIGTMMVQSSVAVAMIVSALSGRAAIGLVPGLAVILGADVGSTFVVQIIAFDIDWLSPLCVLAGVVVFMSADGGIRRHLGRFLIGIGLLLLALRLLRSFLEPLQEASGMIELLAMVGEEPLLAVSLAALLAWLAHSSLAVILLVMSLAAEGVIGIQAAMIFVLGANIGSALVPVAATLKATPQARRVPVGNLAIRGLSALAFLPFLPEIEPWIAHYATDLPRQLAWFHTGFNLALALIFLPLLTFVAALLERILPDPDTADDPAAPRYLDDETDDPSTALAAASREALRMVDVANEMIEQSQDYLFSGDSRLLTRLTDGERVIDQLYQSIKLYLIQIHGEGLDAWESRRHMEIMSLVTNIEHIGDIVDHNLIDAGRKRAKMHISFTSVERSEIEQIQSLVKKDLDLAANVFITRDVVLARRLVDHKSVVRDIDREAGENQLRRLIENGGPAASLHLDVIRDLKRIHAHIAAIAYPLLEAKGELSNSRLVETNGSR